MGKEVKAHAGEEGRILLCALKSFSRIVGDGDGDGTSQRLQVIGLVLLVIQVILKRRRSLLRRAVQTSQSPKMTGYPAQTVSAAECYALGGVISSCMHLGFALVHGPMQNTCSCKPCTCVHAVRQ